MSSDPARSPSTPPAPPPSSPLSARPGGRAVLWPVLALALAGAGAPLAGSSAGLGLLAGAAVAAVVALAQGRAQTRALRWAVWAVAVAAPLALLTRFTLQMAAPNVVTAGQKATERMAVATLRTLLWAQDQMIDLRGRAGLLAELSGARPGPEGALPAPLLRPEFKVLAALSRGAAAAHGGYYFQVWVVAADRAAAHTEGEPPGAPGERAWIAYAWPVARGTSAEAVFCINGHEDILQSPNDGPQQRYDGLTQAPAWDACLRTDAPAGPRLSPGTGRDGGTWTHWRGKRTRRAKAADAAHGPPLE